jgi:oleate hydratase
MTAFFAGSGIGSLAGAVFLIRDAGWKGTDITIFESQPIPGGSLDGAQRPEGYSLRGGRMLTTDHYECLWDLMKSIPSLEHDGLSVYEETVRFNERNPAHSRARLVDANRHIVDVSSMAFTMHDRLELLRLTEATEETLGTSRITDRLSPSFFRSNFWLMWQTTFAFQPWHSAVEFKRYLHRFMNEYPRIETLAGVKRTVYNQYDSLVRPLVQWLVQRGVRFEHGVTVTDVDLRDDADGLSVRGLELRGPSGVRTMDIAPSDLVFIQNASMTDASSVGTMTEPPPPLTKVDSAGWALWEKLAKGRPEFGRPEVFSSSIPESWWESFTVTCRTPAFFEQMESFTGNQAGTGGLVTFQDSRWLMSVVLYHQPHFVAQRPDEWVFWGYALHPDRVGDFVPKPMSECGGADILNELAGHLNFDRAVFEGATCIPCRMPYITSMFMPRARTDRPKPVPPRSRNLAFISQFVEIPDDVVFTVEYSVRAAQTAVYQLAHVDRIVPPITAHDTKPRVLLDSLVKSFS